MAKLSDAELLARLSEAISPGELTSTLERLLRLPEAWRALHDSEFLDAVRRDVLPAPITGSRLAALSIDAAPDLSAAELPFGFEARVAPILQAAVQDDVAPSELDEVALLAVALLRQDGDGVSVKSFAETILTHPSVWRSALCAAIPHLSRREEWLTALAGAGHSAGAALATNALLANLSPDAASEAIARAFPGRASGVAAAMRRLGEPVAAQSLALQVTSDSGPQGMPDSIEAMIQTASLRIAEGDTAAARDWLERAWELSVDASALIADRIADSAEAEGDAVVAGQALRLAYQARPTPSRRARWIHNLADTGNEAEVITHLPDIPQTFEEKAAAGLFHLRRGETDRAKRLFSEAAAEAAAAHPEPIWFDRLARGLKDLGEVSLAIRVAEVRVASYPGDLPARLDLGQLLAEAREDEAAIEQARLVLTLAPSSAIARRILARCLTAAGRTAEALPHWQVLSATDPAHLQSLVECALLAGEVETAKAFHQPPADNPSPEVEVLSARVLIAQQESERAIAGLQSAAERFPESEAIWLELARAQSAAGDMPAAESTLESALRSQPASAVIRTALAGQQLDSGRHTEAAETARLAWEAAPHLPETCLTYARALNGLGRAEDSIPVLRQALARWPGLAPARRSLAQALEGRGDFAQAAGLFDDRRDPESLEDLRLIARLSLRSIDDQAASPALERAKRLLAAGRTLAPADADLAYWQGRADELSGESSLALEGFRESLSLGAEAGLRHQAILGLASAALAGGDVSLSISTLEEARRADPQSPELLALLSKSYLAARLEEQALAAAESWLAAAPGPEALANLAHVSAAAGRWDRALGAYQELASAHPDDAQVGLHLAQAQWKSSQPAAARTSAARAILAARRDPPMLAKAAELVAESGDVAAAQRLLRHAASLAPATVSIFRALAQCSDRLGDHTTSHEAWSRLTVLVPQDAAAWKGAAASAWQRDLRAAAIGHWQKAIGLTPEDLSLKITLARALVQNGEVEASLQMYRAAQEQDPQDGDLALEAGLVEMRQSSPESALVTLAHAARLATDRAEPQVALAECLIRLNRPEEALEALDLAHSAGDTSVRGHALRALTLLAAGDLPQALASVADARSRPTRTAEDATWLAQAALALGQWSIALQALEDWVAAKSEPAILRTLLQARIRIASAQWVYATAAEAVRHAPATGAGAVSDRAAFESWIARASEIGVHSSSLEDLNAAFQAALGEPSPDSIARLANATQHGRQPELAHALAVAHLRAQRPDLAQGALEQIRAVDPWGWTHILLGLARTASKDHAGAYEALVQARRNPALRPLTDWLAGRAALAAGESEEALKAFNAALLAWPDEPAWQAQLASVYLDQGSLENALPHLQEAVELAPEQGDYRLILARALRDAGQLSEAAAAYERVVQAMPKLGGVWKEAAELALAVGDASRAQRWYERACTLSPSDASCLMGAARAALALGQTREANTHALAAQRVAPDDPEVLLGWGEVLAAQGKPEKALQAMEKALSQAEDPVPVQLARGRLLVTVGRATEAVAELRQAVQAEPDNDAASAALAEACEASGDLDAGLEAAGEAARLAPRKVAHRVLIGRLARRSGQLDRALSELVHAQSLSPTDGRVALELGRIHEDRREVKRALDAYQRAIDIDPDYAPAHFRAGLILKELKAYSQAGRMFKRAVELNPTDSEALHQLAAVRALELVHGGMSQPAVTS